MHSGSLHCVILYTHNLKGVALCIPICVQNQNLGQNFFLLHCMNLTIANIFTRILTDLIEIIKGI